MTTPKKDPLLRITRILLKIAMGFVIFGGIVLAIMIPVMWFYGDEISAKAIVEGARLTDGLPVLAIGLVMLAGIGLLTLAFQFLRKLVAIIDTVGEGSPFVPENAVRLRTMGWLVVAMQGIVLACVPLAIWLIREIPQARHEISSDFSLDFGSILLALLLFILARVFDQGTRLAEDAEGTV